MTELDTTPAPDDLPGDGSVAIPEPSEAPSSEPQVEPPAGTESEADLATDAEPVAQADDEAGAEPATRANDADQEAATAEADPVIEAEPTVEPAAASAPEAPAVAEAAPTPEPVSEPGSEPEPTAESADPVADAGPRTVGRYIADQLRAAGVRYAFTVPGESFLGLLDALEGAGIRVVATRHEGAAAFMAEAHGQLTGRPAACLATRGPGGTNLGVGIHTARQDSTPMFVLVGQVCRDVTGFESFQEIDQVATLGGLAKWAAEPRSADEVPEAMAEASRQALGGRPGPVLLSLAEDLLDEPMPDDVRVDGGRPAAPRPTDDEIRVVIELLASAERPVILAGAGVLRARTSTELLRFAELLQVPIVAAWRRADVVSNDNPLFLGMAGFGAASTVRQRLAAADALLVIGSRLNEPTTFGYTMPRPGLAWAHVDLAPGASPGSPAPSVSVTADAKAFLKAANERLLGRAVLDAGRVATRQAANRDDRAAWEAASVVDATPWDGPGVHPGRTIATLRRILPDDAILTTDAGNFASWAGRGFRFRRPGTFLGPTSGAMGYGLPAAVAAALVHRDRHVVALVGDGGMAMTMAEIETAVRTGARVVAIVFDNERYGTIRMWQERRGTGIGVGTELGPVDFAAIARACGARGVRVERDDDFEPALRAALAADRTTVIQLAVDRAWLSIDDRPA
ncbi:MAG TPA: thiamine pyrophosphate-dependent enzyme [Candidatus Limnocylindrales bacterium]|nr:thiamine pyrophosphate-dependent enzyme [Candidatus Limnocylindrales bacterium]